MFSLVVLVQFYSLQQKRICYTVARNAEQAEKENGFLVREETATPLQLYPQMVKSVAVFVNSYEPSIPSLALLESSD